MLDVQTLQADDLKGLSPSALTEVAAKMLAHDFCISRAGRHAVAFLAGWSGTLVCDDYAGYDAALKLETRIEAGCTAHSRRKFDELIKTNQSPVATQAVQRIAAIYRVEREAKELSAEVRLAVRQARSKPLCKEMLVWLQLERQRVPDGSRVAGAIDYSLNRWGALTRFLEDGNVPIDNNHCENLMRHGPWVERRGYLQAANWRASAPPSS